MQRTNRLTGAFVRSGVTRTMGMKHSSTVTSAGFENVPTGHEEQASPASDRRKIVLFGGNGFVGQGIVNSALKSGVDVVSISRSGQPKNFKPPAFSSGKIEWKMGDINDPSTYKDELKDAVGVISCVGAFGSNEFMEKMNGDANITAISESLRAGVPRFVYVSTVENNLPDFFLRGYFHGKRRAEQALQDAYPRTGVILRPGMIHGTRNVPLPKSVLGVSELPLPLWALGKPLEMLLTLPPFKLARDNLPGMKALLAPPIARDSLARVAVAAATGGVDAVGPERVLSVNDIAREDRRLLETSPK